MEKIQVELSKEEVERLRDYMGAGIGEWFEFHRGQEEALEFDQILWGRLAHMLYELEKRD